MIVLRYGKALKPAIAACRDPASSGSELPPVPQQCRGFKNYRELSIQQYQWRSGAKAVLHARNPELAQKLMHSGEIPDDAPNAEEMTWQRYNHLESVPAC